jgi:hypothetical protein
MAAFLRVAVGVSGYLPEYAGGYRSEYRKL